MPWFCVQCGKVNPDLESSCRTCGSAAPQEAVRVSSARLRGSDPAAVARPSLEEGATIGPYRLEEHIGSGGMATVFRARGSRDGLDYAVKVLASNLTRSEKIVARFRQEARIQGQLQHPGIVRVFDVVEDGRNIALVMEFVRGETLETWLDRLDRPTTLAECCNLMVPLLDALEFAHQSGVVHRDLKPSNVLLQPDPRIPGGLLPKIGDFGVAKLLTEAGLRTATGATLGTSWYMAPEQGRGARDVDHRADVYAAGVILFEFMTGRVPFDGETEYAVIDGHIRQQPPRPSILNPAVSPSLEAVILSALEKDPAERFQSARAFRDALQACRALPGVASAAAPAGYASPTYTAVGTGQTTAAAGRGRIPRWALWAGGAFLALGVAAVAVVALTNSPEPTPDPGDETPIATPPPAVPEPTPVPAPTPRPPDPEPEPPAPPTPVPPDPGREALSAYRQATQAFNDGDEASYVGAFRDPISCWYNNSYVGVRTTLGRARLPALRNGYSIQASTPVVESSTSDTVVLRDTGLVQRPGHPADNYEKKIRMKKIGGRWLVDAEVERSLHSCWPGAF